jgi:DNA invertase Pin-like site-specific DNA recombinase
MNKQQTQRKPDLSPNPRRELTEHYYSGRSRGKRKEEPIDLTKLPCQKLAIVYKRLSTHEQVRDHLFSLKMQDALADMAKRDGYPEELIYVEDRDLGLSGTLGSDERPGLAQIIELIEQDKAESVYVVHASRLYRDQTLIDGFAFGELCKKHGVIIVTPSMRLNLRDDMHMRVYRMELDWSAQELKIIKERMHGARDFKARQGFYAGGQLAAGFILDTQEGSPTYEKIVPYEPHAEVVRYIFQKAFEHQCRLMPVIRAAKKDGIYFPFFPPELGKEMNHRTGLKFTKKHSRGWIISSSLVRSILSNPVHIGWWLWKSEIINRQNHPPIIDEELFWAIQEMMRSKNKRTWSKTELMPLAGLLFCGEHGDDNGQAENKKPTRITIARSHPRYECYRSYRNGTGDRICLLVKDYVLDLPICTFVVAQCSYANYLEKVLEHLTGLQRQEGQRTVARKQELERIEAEIENLKSHLAITRSPEQASIVLDEIEKKIAQKRTVVAEDADSNQGQAAPAAALSQRDIDRIREFLTNIGDQWDSLTDELKNRFLTSILDSVLIHHKGIDIVAEIRWKTGLVQKLWIRRPYEPHDDAHGWTEQENGVMRSHYADATIPELSQMLPQRTWIAIKHQAKKLELHRKNTDRTRKFPQREWTEQDDEVVRQYYRGEVTIQEAAEILGRSMSAVSFRGLVKLGLKKTKETRQHRKAVEWGVLDDGLGGKTIAQIEDKLEQKNKLSTLGKYCSSCA